MRSKLLISLTLAAALLGPAGNNSTVFAAPNQDTRGPVHAPELVRPSPSTPVDITPAAPHDVTANEAVSLAAAPALQPGSLVTGRSFTCAISIRQSVRCWGYNGSYALGDSGSTNSPTPVDVVSLPDAVAKITAGSNHVCVITIAGGALCWGNNERGQLGAGSSSAGSPFAVNVSGLSSSVLDIASSDEHTCAVKISGEVWCWGNNSYGQLGNGTRVNSNAPVLVAGLAGSAKAVGTGIAHSCALMVNNTVKCWGNNLAGQLGGSPIGTDSLTPVTVPGIGNAAQLAGASYHNCILTSDGAVKCWGYGFNGQLGSGNSNSSATPVQVIGLTTGVAAIATGGYHGCALLNDSSVKCWGGNFLGQLGDGGTLDQFTPVAVARLSNDTAWIATGENHSCALSQVGKIRCWGANGLGELGDGTVRSVRTPVAVVGLSSGTAGVSAGGFHACGVANGGARCWGQNSNGQLGNGTRVPSSSPVAVSGLSSGVSTVVAGIYHSCAIMTSTTVRCWGANSSGQLGDGSNIDRPTPVDVPGLVNVTQLALGLDYTCAVTQDGTARCWGDNQNGQLGDGSTTSRNAPTVVSGLSNVQRISTGQTHTCAVAGGGAKCWGANRSGQLGNGNTTRQLTPVSVPGLSTGVADVGAGLGHTCALTTGGSLKCWGDNYYGQLGNGSRTNSLTPVDVAVSAQDAQKLATGENYNCLITTSKKLYCWGANLNGELGNGSADQVIATPTLVGSESDVTAVSAGLRFTCIIAAGAARCFGNNNEGELGNGVQLIFGVVDVFGVFIATAPRSINYSVVSTVNTSSAIDVANAYGVSGFLQSYTQPLHGVASCTSGGQCVYTPTTGYTGPDGFTYVLVFGGDPGQLSAASVNYGATVTGTVTLLVARSFVRLPLVTR